MGRERKPNTLLCAGFAPEQSHISCIFRNNSVPIRAKGMYERLDYVFSEPIYADPKLNRICGGIVSCLHSTMNTTVFPRRAGVKRHIMKDRLNALLLTQQAFHPFAPKQDQNIVEMTIMLTVLRHIGPPKASLVF